MQSNPWDILGKNTFNTQVSTEEIDSRAADNVLIAWSPILELLQNRFPATKGIKILDFGCGVGGFCNKLNNLGFEVTGLDSSRGMIDSAKKHSSITIKYILGDQLSIPLSTSFDAIVSIMTFPFIKNIGETFQILTKPLSQNGLFIIAVFNPEWVKACLQRHVSFTDFDSVNNPKVGLKTFGDLKTPVYIRSASVYIKLAANEDLQIILETYPPFTPDFIEKYPDNRPKHVSEFIILGFNKSRS